MTRSSRHSGSPPCSSASQLQRFAPIQFFLSSRLGSGLVPNKIESEDGHNSVKPLEGPCLRFSVRPLGSGNLHRQRNVHRPRIYLVLRLHKNSVSDLVEVVDAPWSSGWAPMNVARDFTCKQDGVKCTQWFLGFD